jgi:hypothetical protein
MIDGVDYLSVAHQPLEVLHFNPDCRYHVWSSEQPFGEPTAARPDPIFKTTVLSQGFFYFASKYLNNVPYISSKEIAQC